VKPIPHAGLHDPPELPLDELPLDDPVPEDDPLLEDPPVVAPSEEASLGVVDTPPPHWSERIARPTLAKDTCTFLMASLRSMVVSTHWTSSHFP
jgi:hypothetical protein